MTFSTASLSTRIRLTSFALGALLVGCAATSNDGESTATAEVKSGTADGGAPAVDADVDSEVGQIPQLPVQWPNRGSATCVNHVNSEPVIYKFQYDPNTIILRENKCFNYEANFIYILFGNDKVLVQDTGSIPQGFTKAQFTQMFPLRDTVETAINAWLAAHPMELLITHSHSHGDHVSGDYQFVQANGQPYPHTKLAGYRPADVAAFFGITNWPNTSVSVDLGGRVIDVLPIPGHEAAHVALYDHGAKLLLSGDSLYPGHVFVNDWNAFKASTARLSAWLKETDADGKKARPVNYVLGTHIEKKPEAGKFYSYGAKFHETERKLELTTGHVDELAGKIQELNVNPHNEVFMDDYGIDPQ